MADGFHGKGIEGKPAFSVEASPNDSNYRPFLCGQFFQRRVLQSPSCGRGLWLSLAGSLTPSIHFNFILIFSLLPDFHASLCLGPQVQGLSGSTSPGNYSPPESTEESTGSAWIHWEGWLPGWSNCSDQTCHQLLYFLPCWEKQSCPASCSCTIT